MRGQLVARERDALPFQAKPFVSLQVEVLREKLATTGARFTLFEVIAQSFHALESLLATLAQVHDCDEYVSSSAYSSSPPSLPLCSL